MSKSPESQPVSGTPAISWLSILAIGVVYLVGGLVALGRPVFASIFVETLIAAAFFIGGIIAMWLAWRDEDGTTGGRLFGGLTGLLAVVVAIAFWTNPLGGLVSLTITLGALFVALGVMRLSMGWRMKSHRGWGWIVASGVLTLGLGLYILFTLPTSALSVLGIIFGIELTMAGVAHIMMALAVRKVLKA